MSDIIRKSKSKIRSASELMTKYPYFSYYVQCSIRTSFRPHTIDNLLKFLCFLCNGGIVFPVARWLPEDKFRNAKVGTLFLICDKCTLAS